MKRTFAGLGLTAALLVAASGAQADDIEYRQAVYKAIGGHMTALVNIIRQDVPHTDDVAVHAEGIADLAPLTRHIFPEGSGEGDTEALPEIWEDPEGFEERRQAFEDAAQQVNNAAGGPMRQFVGAFQELGDTCKDCHDNYREE